ncbi:hypothetical protein [Streptomyces sp. NPDC003719]
MRNDRTLLVVVAAIGAAVVGIAAMLAPHLINALTVSIAAFALLLVVLGA